MKIMLNKALVLAVIVLFIGAGFVSSISSGNSSSGNTIYVDDDNIQGPWDGSIQHPFQFIQDGITDADSDTINCT